MSDFAAVVTSQLGRLNEELKRSVDAATRQKGQGMAHLQKEVDETPLPNHQGYYECYICGKWVLQSEVELDHVKSRSRHPELVFDEGNIRPICHSCNTGKGSKDYE